MLVIASLLLLTVYFRESSGGGLHRMQSTGASVLKPFEVAAERVARPFRDAAGWAGDVIGARNENKRLRRELDAARQSAIGKAFYEKENIRYRSLLKFVDGPQFPKDFAYVATRIISHAPSEFEQRVGINAGASSGIRVHDPVVGAHGLVGQVTQVADATAQVTLLTDVTSAVSAVDVQTHADGIVQRLGSSLNLTRVTKDKVVNADDVVVTAGWRAKGFASIYPRGLPICRVTKASQTDTDLYKQVLCESYVNFGALEVVAVLVPKSRAH